MKPCASVCGDRVNEQFFFILLLTTTLPFDKVLPDSVTAPRWYVTFFVACLWGVIALLKKKCCIDYKVCFLLLLFISAIHIMIFFFQQIGLVYADKEELVCFSNVAGLSSCLCFSMPAISYLIKSDSKPVKIASLCVLTGSILVILCLHSRAGIICIAFWGGSLIYRRRTLLSVYIGTILLLLPLLLWQIKPASTLGRWFIIQRTIDMIMEYPLTGWGVHGFEANYMHIQSDFLAKHPNIDSSQLADDVCHPLNEYLLIAVDFGLIGVLVIVLFIWYVFFYFRKHKSVDGFVGITTLILIAVFSMFSYPLAYPFTWIVLLFSLYLIFRGGLNFRVKGILAKWFLFVFIFMGCLVLKGFQYGIEWKKLNDKMNDGYRVGVRQHYEKLYPVLRYNSRFLYNYAYALYRLGQYEKSLTKAMECRKIRSDYNLSLLFGDIYWALGKDELAIGQYMLAHHMCPCRFAPLCAIYDVYKRQCNYIKCLRMSNVILNKPVKVDSPETLEYIEYIRQDVSPISGAVLSRSLGSSDH